MTTIHALLCLLLATSATMAQVPSDAVALLEGDLSDHWIGADGNEPAWALDDGVLRIAPGTGSIHTSQAFGDMIMHVEFRLPETGPDVTGQAKSNSGVYIQQRYEVQILDSHGDEPDARSCGAIYARKAADVDATLPAGQWQRYDIIFRAPRYDSDGTKVANARLTVRHNGTLIHDDVEVEGKTGAGQPESPDPMPLLLQDHGAAIEFRNIWVLDLHDGWEDIFGGSVNRWIRRGGQAEYVVEDGTVIRGQTRPNQPNTFLCTPRSYADFLLSFECKVDDELNSGVQIRSLSLPEYKNGRVHGYQVEMDPSDRAWTAGIYDEARRGWLDDLADNEPARLAFRHNEWNHILVEAEGDRIRTWINGVPAADLTDDMTPSGFIGLQVHGVGGREDPLEVRWRHLLVKELD